MKSRSEAPPCGGCGRPVVGHVPSPGGEGTPCCSVECARVLWLRDRLATTERERDELRAKLGREVEKAAEHMRVLSNNLAVARKERDAAEQAAEQALASLSSSSPPQWVCDALRAAQHYDQRAREQADRDVLPFGERPTSRGVDAELLTSEAEGWREKFRALEKRHRTAIGFLGDAERSLEAIRAFLTAENAR